MKKVKFLTALNTVHLEEFVNEFLESVENKDSVDLQFSTPGCTNQEKTYQFYHAMIIYDK